MDTENWNMHKNANDMGLNIIQLFPIIEKLHNQFNTDIIYIDLNNVNLLFNDKGVLINDLTDSKNPFWTQKNPFPINCIANDNEIISIWDRKIPGTEKMIFTQLKYDIEELIKLKNLNPLNTILIVGTFYKTMQICKLYTIKILKNKNKTTYQLL